MYVLRFFTLASFPPSVPFFQHKVPSIINYLQIPKYGSATFSSFPSQPWCCHFKCGITRNRALSIWWMPCENQIGHEAQFFLKPFSEIQQVDHLIKKNMWKNHSWTQRFQFLYCLACRKHSWEKSWSGLHGDAIWKACSMKSHLEPSKLLFCASSQSIVTSLHFPNDPASTFFNNQKQSVLQCVLSAKLVITKILSAKKWSKHCISLASFLIFSLNGIVSHTIQLSCPSVYSTCGTECFLFSLPCVLSFVTFQILLFIWMHRASLWISDSTTSSKQVLLAELLSIILSVPIVHHCLQSFISIVFSSFRCSPNHHWLLSLALLAFAEVFEIENTIKKPVSFFESYWQCS